MNVLFALVFLPAYFLGKFFLNNDPGPKEPQRALRRAVSFGLLALSIALAVSFLIDVLLGSETLVYGLIYPSTWSNDDHISLFLHAFTEEAAKFVPLAVYVYHRRYFNEVTDGLIYFIFVGLTFGVIETLGYAIFGGSIITALMRFAFAIFLHAATTGIVGYTLARKKMKHVGMGAVVVALIGVSLLHYLYNLGIALSSETSILILISIAVSFGLNGAMFWLFYKAAKDDILSGRLEALVTETQQSHQYAQQTPDTAATGSIENEDTSQNSSSL